MGQQRNQPQPRIPLIRGKRRPDPDLGMLGTLIFWGSNPRAPIGG